MGFLARMKEAQIGDLDRKITINSLTYTKGSAGEQLPDVETAVEVWAKVEYRFGDEQVEARRVEMNSRVQFTIRHYPSLTNKHWVEFEGKRYDIIHIEELGRRRFTVVLTELRI